jgi:GWxTD domain-containing protein
MKRPAAALLAVNLVLASCASARLERSLDPDSREFLSKVRYLITPEERRTLRNLPVEERRAFVGEFWSKRDPDPSTEENEFKTEYFARIEEANHLFTAGGGGEPGWLQDRGRMYILLGPPDVREQYPRGVTFYGIPTEIWYYGFFSIVFVDPGWNGDYHLDPDSAIQLAQINKTQMDWKPQVASVRGLLDCRIGAEIQAAGKALIKIEVPYRRIWFKDDNGALTATLSVALDILDSKQDKASTLTRDYPLSLTAERLEKIGRTDFVIEIPVQLAAGKYWIQLTLRNTADSAKIFKRIPLNL